MNLARAIANYGFPKPIALSANRLAWHLEEVEEWIASRPRRTPKCDAYRLKTEAAAGEARGKP
jgi:hypothetical protein